MNSEYCAIVISYREYREHDAIIKLLDENGTISSLIARGVQKINSKNAAGCQQFTYGRYFVNERQSTVLHSLRSAECLRTYRDIREDLYMQSIASYMCEVIEKSDFGENAFPLLKTMLEHLSKKEQPFGVLCLFQAIVNRMHGIEPCVEGCVHCGTTKRIASISVQAGGFLCQSCMRMEDQLHTVERLKKFRLLVKAHLEHISLVLESACFDFDDFLIQYCFFAEYAGVSVKSIRFLKHLYALHIDKT